MKQSRKVLYGLVELPLDSSVALVAKRFLVRLAIISVFASLPIAGNIGFRGLFITLSGVNIVMCVVWALVRREQPKGAGLTHWDEALIMTGLWFAAHLI